MYKTDEQKERKYWDAHWYKKIKSKKFIEIEDYQERRYYRAFNKILTKALRPLKGKRVCELGSGSGNHSFVLAKQGNYIYLVDISKPALTYSRKLGKIYKLPSKVHFVNSSIFKTKFNDSFFDCCFNSGVIEHYNLGDVYKIILEMKRITKNNGVVLIAFPNLLSITAIYFFLKSSIRNERFYTPSRIIKILKELNFYDIRIENFPIVFPPGYSKYFYNRLNLIEKFLSKLNLGFLFIIIAKVKK